MYFINVFSFCFVYILAGSGYTALDMDQPLCNLGFPGFLRLFQLLLGRSNMVRNQLRTKKKKNLIVVILVDLFFFIVMQTT